MLAISVTNSELIKKMLNEKGIQFSYDSTMIWQTIEPKKSELFFIEYNGKNWKESQVNTTHPNTATSLIATYILTDNFETEEQKYKRLGITESESGIYLETPYKRFKIGQNNLYLLDGAKSKKISQFLNSKNLLGICGFKIKVNSIQTFNKGIKQSENVKYEGNSTTIYLKNYHSFLIFTE
jgi:hypothetical protein